VRIGDDDLDRLAGEIAIELGVNRAATAVSSRV